MRRSLLAGMLFVMVLANSVFAVGALFARRAFSKNEMKPLWLTNYIADVTITDQIAVTHVDQTFKNETSERLEGIFVFPLPPNAIITELALWENGKKVVASIKEKDTAKAIYDGIVSKMMDPALLEYMGNNLFRLSVFPIEPAGNIQSERRIEVTYVELLPYTMSQVEYRFLMKTLNLSPKPVQRSSISFSLSSQKKILSLTSPSHEGNSGYFVTKKSETGYTGIYGNENSFSDKDFRLAYRFEAASFALNHLTYAPGAEPPLFFDAPGDNPYFVLWVTTPDTIKIMQKDVVFIADISSSMAGMRIVQLKKSLRAMIGMLNPGDRFNVVAFSSSTRPFRSDLVAADSGMKAAAIDFVNQLTEMGLTNMEDAFKAGLSASWNAANVNSVVFLTDGKPTWPVSSTPKSVTDTVLVYNKAKATVHAFGIGEEVEEPFLTSLAKGNGGTYTHIAVDDSISSVMTAFMHMISYPLIKNCALSYGGLETCDVLPNPLPNLVATSQLTVLGRYKGTGTYRIGFAGSAAGSPLALSGDMSFPAGASNHPFVPRMWASAKISALLEQIAMYGEKKELVDAVKALGLKYSIVTPYTSLLAVPTTLAGPGHVIEDKTAGAATDFGLTLHSRGPVVSSATLRYTVPQSATPRQISIRIYDAKGRLVCTLVNDVTLGGTFIAKWDARDTHGKRVAPGLFFAVLESPDAKSLLKIRVL